MNIMSLRGAFFAKQSLVTRGDCFATCARNDMWAKVNALRELQSAGGKELSTLMPSMLDRAFKGEL
jgi:hypothetical protein